MTLPNIHPVDELASVKEEIKILENRADELRASLLEDGADLDGKLNVAQITSQTRETLDKQALIEMFGEDAIKPFIKTSTFKVLKIKEKRK